MLIKRINGVVLMENPFGPPENRFRCRLTEVRGLDFYGFNNSPGITGSFGFWLPVPGSRGYRELPPEIQSGIEDHIAQVQSEEDMDQLIHELYLRR